jgi:lipopolysaccharide export system permease protein
MVVYRYLAKELYAITIANTIVLLLIFISNQFIQYMSIAAAGSLTAHLVFVILLLKTPQLLGTLLPLSLFLAIMLGYSRLYADNEMTVLLASGFNLKQLYKITLLVGITIMLITSILMLWVSPIVNRYADDLIQKGALSPLELITPGKFQSVQSGRWIFYAQSVSTDHAKLQDIFVVDQDPNTLNDNQSNQDKQAKQIIKQNNLQLRQGFLFAKNGHQYVDPVTNDMFLIFNNGERYSGIPGKSDYEKISFEQYGIRLGAANVMSRIKADSIGTIDLLKMHKNDKQAAELQWRFSMPIMAVILVLMAVPLSKVKSRQGRFKHIVPAILLYMLYGNFMFIGRDWITNGKISHTVGLWWVHLLMLCIALLIIFYDKIVPTN